MTYLFVLIAPVRVAEESTNSNRLVASPWQVFTLNVVVSAGVFMIFFHDYLLVAALAGENPVAALLVLSWYAWFPDAVLDMLISAAKDPVEYMDRLRVLMNLIGAPTSFIIYAFIASWLAKHWKRAVSRDEVYAAVLISNSFCYFYFVVFFVLGFYANEPIYWLPAYAMIVLGMPVLTAISLRRVSGLTLRQATSLTILSAILALPLCYPLFMLIELLALVPSPVYAVL